MGIARKVQNAMTRVVGFVFRLVVVHDAATSEATIINVEGYKLSKSPRSIDVKLKREWLKIFSKE